MNTIRNQSPYALIVGADSLMAKSYALDLAKKQHNLLLIAKPQRGLMDWALQLMSYGVEVNFFETDPSDHNNLELLANWIHSSYSVSHFLNLSETEWLEEIFPIAGRQTKKVA